MSNTNGHARWTVLQARVEALQKKAEERVNAIVVDGRGVFQEVWKRWRGSEAGTRLKKLANDGRRRFNTVVTGAETATEDVLGRVERLQGAALESMGVATRGQLTALTREVKRLVKKAEKITPPR